METALVADGNGPAISWAGGVGTFAARGTFGSGTVTMQYCPQGADTATAGNWHTVAGISFTAANEQNFTLGVGNLRAVLAGSTNPSITCAFCGVLGRAYGNATP